MRERDYDYVANSKMEVNLMQCVLNCGSALGCLHSSVITAWDIRENAGPC